MDALQIRTYMTRGSFYPNIQVLEETDSTNNFLRKKAASGAPEGSAVLALRQFAGKGRMGHHFSSPPGGLYLSVLLRPSAAAVDIAMMTACAGVCVAAAIERICPVKPTIKWVNDLLVGTEKICGILAESSLSPNGYADAVVLGIGVNVNTDALPPNIHATSLALLTGMYFPLERVAAAILDEIAAFWSGFPDNAPAFVHLYRTYLSTIGQTITIVGDTQHTPYRVLDIDAQFGLIIEDAAKNCKTLRYGEVRIKAQ